MIKINFVSCAVFSVVCTSSANYSRIIAIIIIIVILYNVCDD